MVATEPGQEEPRIALGHGPFYQPFTCERCGYQDAVTGETSEEALEKAAALFQAHLIEAHG